MAKINDTCRTMIDQIGGNKACVMVGGSYTYDNENNQVIFKYKGSKHSNYMRMTYEAGLDLYTLQFIKIWGTKYSEKEEFTGVYNDMVKDIFESTTGLYLSL